MKRRKDQTAQFDQSDGAMAGAGQDAMAQIPAPNTPNQANLHDLQEMVQAVMSEDSAAQLDATTRFRKLLSIGAPPSRLCAMHKETDMIDLFRTKPAHSRSHPGWRCSPIHPIPQVL